MNTQKLATQKLVLVGFMLFSMFFGAGNLIFPPYLGQSAAGATPAAMAGFLITAVVLPVLGVVVVARFGGLVPLGSKVEKHFGLLFSVLIYLTVGPGLAIPRAASLPFEMAVAPYISVDPTIWRVGYSLVFFLVALWLSLTPSKLVERIGKYTAPTLVFLLIFLFINYVIRGDMSVGTTQEAYSSMPFLKGFAEGYNTLDAIAGLNYGMVIVVTFETLGVTRVSDQVKYTIRAGILAGVIIAGIYIMLSYMGMYSSGVYELHENGAWTIRSIVYQLFGNTGAILVAAIFTLACLNTCVGLINSCSQFFSQQFRLLSHRQWVFAIVICAFFVCNMGLNAILSISVPILSAIYPAAIVLIMLAMTHKLWGNNRFIYPLTVLAVAAESVIYSLESLGVPLGVFSSILARILPLYDMGYGWLGVAVVMVVVSVVASMVDAKK